MSTLETTPQFRPLTDGGQTESQKHPQNEGVFALEEPLRVLPLPAFDTEVDMSYRKKLKTERYFGLGTVWLEEWQMSDGVRNQILMAEPRKRRTDIAVAKNTAWGTQVRGFNEDLARMFMQLGQPVVIIGPETGGSIPQSHSAHNTHKILDITEKLGLHEEKIAVVEGYSRGAMIGFGTLAYAARHKRKIIYANLTDPCMAHGIELNSRQLMETLDNFKDAPAELLTTAVQVGRLILNPVKLFHYKDSVDFSVAGFRQFYRTGRPLFTGEAGFLARHVPPDAQATVCFFRRSLANHQAEFIDILKEHDGIEIKRTGFGHTTGMDKRILGNIITRFSGLVDQLGAGVKPADIDYGLVHKSGAPA